MDSLHVSQQQPQQQQQQTGSKASSRSASPCRPKGSEGGAAKGADGHPHHQAYRPHHAKTLSHGSADSAKSHDGAAAAAAAPAPAAPRPAGRHRSPAAFFDVDDAAADDTGGAFAFATLGDANDASDGCYPASHASNGSADLRHFDGEQDGVDPRTNAVLEHLGAKIVRVRDLMRTEQKLRDDNVNEYLKLAANADKHQVQRIKAVFEKKNQKSAQIIAQLQKKLDVYQKKVHELETHGFVQSHRPREVLRDMGQGLKNVGGNIRDGISYVGGSVMSKPREFAHLIKNKFGSADNISQMSRPDRSAGGGGGGGSSAPRDRRRPSPPPSSPPPNAAAQPASNGAGSEGSGHRGNRRHAAAAKRGGSATLPATLEPSGGGGGAGAARRAKFPSDDDGGSECSSVTSDSIGGYVAAMGAVEGAAEVAKKVRAAEAEVERLSKRCEQFQSDVQFLSSALQDERFRTERLEEQINDLTELHQNEVENLKQAMADMEEKVQYQSEERLRDIHEMLEHCQTKIQKMEHQALQQQQYVTLEGLDNSNARALVVKLINVLLTVLQVVLLLVATGAGIIMPFLRTRLRILSTVVLAVAIAFVLKQWPEVRDIGSHMMKRLKDTLDPVQ